MDGEAQVTTSEPVNSAPSNEAPAEATENVSHEANEQPNKPSGFDPVEIPAELKPRFDRVYGNMKRYETQLKQTKDDNQRLMQAFEALQNDQKQIVNHIQTNDFKDAEARLSSDRQAAWDKGDIKAFTAADDQLKQIFVKKTINESLPRQPVEQPKQNGYMNGQRVPVQDAVQQAVESGEMSSQDANIYKSWESQTDDSGMKIRPWTDFSHPDNETAAVVGRSVFTEPAFRNKPIAEKFREIDRRMGLQPQSSQNNSVLGSGNLTRGTRAPKVELSPEVDDKISKMAIRSKFAALNPKLTPAQRSALTDQDHINAYKAVMIRNQQKGGRK